MTKTNRQPLVSIIMATYNSSETILSSIESILNQTYKNIELIIINDKSTDDTKLNISRFINNSRVHVYNNQINIGLAKSLNKAIKASKGDYIARMDDDDISHPNRIQKQIDFFQNNMDIDVLGTSARLMDSNMNFIRKYLPPENDKDIKKNLCHSNPIIHPSVMVSREFFQKSNGYNESLRRKEDLDLWGRMAKKVKFHNLQDCLIDYRVKPNKTLAAVPVGVYIRIKNGLRLGCLYKAIIWAILYIFVEIFRHMGYTQKKTKKQLKAL
mgnify:CR=1 FL=1|jgi:glycosyltransferase involved in cell wall biosynthesis